MGRSCFYGYLTPECANCEDWRDGSNMKDGIGCACHFPIMQCPHFAKMCSEQEADNLDTRDEV